MTDSSGWNKRSYLGDDDRDPYDASGRKGGSSPFYRGDDDVDDDIDDDIDDIDDDDADENSSSKERSGGYGGSSSYGGNRYGSGSRGSSSSSSSGYGSSGSSSYGGSSSRYGGSSSDQDRSSASGKGAGGKPASKGGVGAFLGRFGRSSGDKPDRPAKPRSNSGGGIGSKLTGRLKNLRGKLPGGGKKATSAGSSTSSTGYGSGSGSYGSSTSSNRASSVRTVDRGASSGDGRASSAKKSSGGPSKNPLSRLFQRGGERKPQQPPSHRGGKRSEALPRAARTPRIKNEGLSLDLKLDILGWGLIILSAIIFFGAVSSNPGDLSGVLLRIIYQLVGIGWLAVPVALGGSGIWLIWRRFGESAPEADAVKIAGWVVVYLGLLASFQFVHLLTTPVFSIEQLRTLSEAAAQIGQAGGWIGSTVYLFLMQNIGDIGTFFALVGWLGAGLIMSTDLSIAGIINALRQLTHRTRQRYQFARSQKAPAALAAAKPSTAEQIAAGIVPALGETSSARQALPASDAIPYAESDLREQPVIRRQRGRETVSVDLEAAPTARLEVSSGRYTPVQPAPPSVHEEPEEEVGLADDYTEKQLALKRGMDVLRVRRPAYNEPEEADLDEELYTEEEEDVEEVGGSMIIDSRAYTPSVPVIPERPSLTGSRLVEKEEDEEEDEVLPEPPARPAYPQRESPYTAQPARPSRYDSITARPAFNAGSEADAVEDEVEDNEPDDLARPAQPRDPSRQRQFRPLRPTGTGLSPAEVAAFSGDYADDEEDAEEEDDTDYDEPVYESLEDSATSEEELPAIDLTEDEEDGEDEDVSLTPAAPARPAVSPVAPVKSTPSPAAGSTPSVSDPTAPPFRMTDTAQPVSRPPARPVTPEPVPTRATVDSVDSELDEQMSIPEPSQTPAWVRPDFMRILDPSAEQNINDDLLLERARIIEDTLSSFGAPGKVVEVNPGPAITQFGVEPDYVEGRGGKRTRVKVQAIARLADDLALSLAARSIRIEAPVPGKGFVGIEVPNSETALVGLRDIMESPEYARIDSKLRIGMGQSVDGTPVVADLTAMPHLLIAGTTGSGKSVCVNAIIACLLLQNTPEDLRLIMVDPKRVELTGYNGIPHLVAPVVVDLERIVGVLKWVTREMDDRYRKFNERGARNITTYNAMLNPHEKALPYLVVIIDELADLMMLAPDETERVLTRLAQMSRATGIHLIISTQRPSVDVVTGLIKANFPARVAFAVASSVDSRVILDQPGAERLLGRGDMLFQAPDAAAPARLQGVFVSDTELNRLVNHWKGLRVLEEIPRPTTQFDSTPPTLGPTPVRSIPTVQSRTEKYTAPSAATPSSRTGGANFWDEVNDSARLERKPKTANDDVDDLYDQSVEVVRRLKKASVSLLQRQLRIGYTRAARLIDVMEERGVVGPAQSGSKPRKVIGYSDDDIDFADEDDEDILDDEDDIDDEDM